MAGCTGPVQAWTMSDIPSGSRGGPAYDDRHVHATRAPHTPRPPSDAQEPPFEGPLHLLARTAWQVVLLTGVASLVLGILVLVWPGPSLVAAGILFGVYLIVSGVLQLA